jgi:uncharacterized protein YdcH (DUF465 family)
MNVQALEQKFENLIARIDDAKRQVDSGTLGNFDKLNDEINKICTETQNAGPEAAKALQKHMGRIILKLDELANSISTYKDNLKEKP